MADGVTWWEITLVVLLFFTGVGLACRSYLLSRRDNRTRSDEAKSSLFSSVGTGLLTGATVSIVLLIIQQSIHDAQAEASWQDSVATAAKLSGFDPKEHSVKNMTFSGKDLTGAEFASTDLTGAHFSDAVLKGADFAGAKLIAVNFQSADLSTAEFPNATFSDVDLRGANLSHTAIENPATFELIKANAYTCWPDGFLSTPLAGKIIPTVVVDPSSGKHSDSSKGAMFPNCKLPGS